MATVLIVEDERDIRDLLSEAVRNMGHYAIESSDGQKAVERASIDLPDMILLDVWMPRMNGFEVLRMLGEKPATRDIPVVLITAVPSSEGEKKGRDFGVRHYTEKP